MAEDAKKDAKEEKDGAAEAAPESSGGKSNLMLILGAVALVAVSAGAPTTFFILKEKKRAALEELAVNAANGADGQLAEGYDDEEQIGDDEERLGAILPLDTFLINLDGGQYLRAQLQLEFVATSVPSPFIRNQVVIRDGLISLMSRKKAETLGTHKGREAMKSEIKDLINEVLKREEIKRVFFTQFVIQ